MPQLTENKQNEPILIANFEPTACAGKSAQKVALAERGLQRYRRGLFEDDLPGAVAAEAEAGAAVVVGKSVAVESAGALQAVDDHRGGVAEQIDLNLRPF